MSIYTVNESGTSFHRSRFTKSISYTKRFDCRFGQIIPVLEKFVLPGDVWRISGDTLVRFQPQLAPSLTKSTVRVRYFFIPLRLLEKNAELVITGSQDGHLFSGELPEFDNIFAKGQKSPYSDCFKITKHSLFDYYGCQVGDYEQIKTEKFLPAGYWTKAYFRVIWDYYSDENLSTNHANYADFDDYIAEVLKQGGQVAPYYAMLPKDYFMSSLPWQLKGTAPVVPVEGIASFTPNYPNFYSDGFNVSGGDNTLNTLNIDGTSVSTPGISTQLNDSVPPSPVQQTEEHLAAQNKIMSDYLNQTQNVRLQGLGFNADELRTMMAQTRIFERLARTGSRYVEYLRANFGTAPADDTLQRSQYLGGWKLPIVTTEVLQTAGDGDTPVGTMRGHGITRGGNKINTFFAKEFGIILGLMHILPNVEYTTGCPREMSYKSRFDFFNPSLQHLSEQEVRNGELYVDFTGGEGSDNDETFGFQAYANELRSSQDKTVGELRGNLAYWTQSLSFNSRPNLNQALLISSSHLANFNKNFAVNGADAYPCIVQFRNNLDVYRPMVRYATPGLVDHL